MNRRERGQGVTGRVPVRAGDVFYNPKRGNCLRVIRVFTSHGTFGSEAYAQCLSWRPNGEKGSKPQDVKVESLAQYERVQTILVTTNAGMNVVFDA